MRLRTAVLAPAIVAAQLACEPFTAREPGALVPRTVAEDPSLPAITLNGARFHARSFGDTSGPVVVFLHGGPGGDHRSLLRLADRIDGYSLADDHYLVFWDQRGSGLSERQPRRTLTIDQYDADLLALVDAFSPDRPVILIGQSWGGMYATDFINRHPERVSAAVLIEPGPLTGATAERVKGDMFDMDPGAEWLNDLVWSSQFLSPDDHVRMDFERMIGDKVATPRYHEVRGPGAEPSWRSGAAVSKYLPESGQDASGRFNYDFTTDLAAYTRPVLFIAGALSEVLGPSLQDEQVLRFPDATLEVVAGAGHDVHWVRTREVLAHIRQYLDSMNGGVE